MKTEDKLERFASSRGVAFEIKPRNDPFSIPKPPTSESNSHGSNRSMGRTSSHFCDLEIDANEDEDEDVDTLEKGCYDKEGPILQIPQKGSCPLPFLPPKTLSEREKNKKKSSRLSIILLDQGLFTVYKRLFALSLVLNITFLILASTGNFPYARKKAVLFSIGNIFALTLCRSEAFLRVVFWLAVNCLGWSWIPIRIKTIVTSLLQSLGGIHSGCAISSIAWLVYALIQTLKDKENTSPEIVGVAFAILSLLFLSSLAAFPLVRHLHHNFFERIHRFVGWIALALLWIFITLTVSYNPETKSYNNAEIGSKLIKQQEFLFTLAITVLIILPWITVRRVPVKVTSPSGHATIIKFEGGVKAGILGRISPSPLSEWHAFGFISDGKAEHMMLAGAVGDFTKTLVSNPPSHLWVRQVHFAGLPYLVNMYNRVLVVATGSGICVFLSFLLQPSAANVCFLWVTKGVEQNFGKEIKEMLSGHPKEKVIIHDTALLGRPNVSEMSVDVARKWGAEVVIVTSNPEGSRDVVNACKKSGIPACGPIWDS
ncbi:adenylate-forming reductase 06235-like [Solanum verrucosum]|uniref:adenylate-forming reductase 06235-like n=1 Tax=Solanum verrucosum TaxID=315347 RepID=UPI0020D14A0B|nr:adenylate-forming reductase 06235-like [Solanum verrucosum]